MLQAFSTQATPQEIPFCASEIMTLPPQQIMMMQHPQPMLAMLPVQPQQPLVIVEQFANPLPTLQILLLCPSHLVQQQPVIMELMASPLPTQLNVPLSMLQIALLPQQIQHIFGLPRGLILPPNHPVQQPPAILEHLASPFRTELHPLHLLEVLLSEAEIHHLSTSFTADLAYVCVSSTSDSTLCEPTPSDSGVCLPNASSV